RRHEARIAEGRLQLGEIGAAVRPAIRRRRARRLERRARGDGSWAVDAIDLDGVARLAIELAVAVTVLPEMAVDALHAALEMNVLQMDGQPRPHRIAVWRRRTLRDRRIVLDESWPVLVRKRIAERFRTRVGHRPILRVEER